MMSRFVKFFKNETVLCISGLLATISCFIVPPSDKYLDYINFRVLILLFCLMIIVAGIRKSGAFTVICEYLLKKFHSLRSVCLMLVLISFFMSMFLTNDVTLVTIVPFTLLIFENVHGDKKSLALIFALVFETLGANLGSMLTPMGNPQNLYLYSNYKLTIEQFLKIIYPYSLLSLILLIASVYIFIPNLHTSPPRDELIIDGKLKLTLYLLLFLLSMLAISGELDVNILLIIVCLGILILDRSLFLKVDYSLLFTFVFFFIFVGNICSIHSIHEALSKIFSVNKVGISVLLSQVISNVPASLLLSEISDNAKTLTEISANAKALIIGTNLGGLGTLIASMASLISYKFYLGAEGSIHKKYVLIFTLFNLAFLLILLSLYAIIG